MSERKQQILLEAIGIITTEGYSKLTMRALARASGMQLGALQYHFRTREDMLRALALYISDEYRQSFEALTSEDALPSLKELVQFVLDGTPGSKLQSDRLFPLDAPAGPFADRMIWFSSNVGAFAMGWVVQMIAMLTLTLVFAGTTWQVRESHPLTAFVAGTALLIAVVAFIIPKFIAIWSIPQMVMASSTISSDVAVAEQLFQLLNPSLPFSLFQSFDYLGFWMYGVFGLLIARPLFRLSLSARIAAVALGLFGLLFHILLVGVLTGSVITADIGLYFESLGGLLLIPVIGMAFYFRKSMKSEDSQ